MACIIFHLKPLQDFCLKFPNVCTSYSVVLGNTTVITTAIQDGPLKTFRPIIQQLGRLYRIHNVGVCKSVHQYKLLLLPNDSNGLLFTRASIIYIFLYMCHSPTYVCQFSFKKIILKTKIISWFLPFFNISSCIVHKLDTLLMHNYLKMWNVKSNEPREYITLATSCYLFLSLADYFAFFIASCLFHCLNYTCKHGLQPNILTASIIISAHFIREFERTINVLYTCMDGGYCVYTQNIASSFTIQTLHTLDNRGDRN